MQGKLKSNQCVQQSDYDKYIIPASVKSLYGKKRSIYLFKELEKRHPCFNSDFCVDSILKVVNKKIVFDVVVMNKLKFMEYKSKKNLFFMGLRFNDPLFPFRFLNKALLKKICLSLIAFFILFVFVYSNALHKTEVVEENLVNEQISVESITEKVSMQYKFFLDKVKEKHGFITSFTWKFDGYFEEITCFIEKMYPEDLEEIFGNINTIVDYRNGIPMFSIISKKKIYGYRSKEKLKEEKLISNDSLLLCETRKIIMNSKGKIVDEHTTPIKISFICENDFVLIEKIGLLLKEKNIALSEISIKKNSNTEIKVELSFNTSLLYCDGLLLNEFREYESIFFTDEKNIISFPKKITNDLKIIDENKTNEKLSKMGEIVYEDGKKLIFCKNEKGKIVKKMEE